MSHEQQNIHLIVASKHGDLDDMTEARANGHTGVVQYLESLAVSQL